jgi:hypothetical protein
MKRILIAMALLVATGWADEGMGDFMGGVYTGSGIYATTSTVAIGDGIVIRSGNTYFTDTGICRKAGAFFFDENDIVLKTDNSFISNNNFTTKASNVYVGTGGVTVYTGIVIFK